VTLLTFAAEHRAAALLLLLSGRHAATDQYLPPTGYKAANPQQRVQQTNDGTEKLTDANPLHKPCSAHYASSVN